MSDGGRKKRSYTSESLPLAAKGPTNIDGRLSLSLSLFHFRPVDPGTGSAAAPSHVRGRHLGRLGGVASLPGNLTGLSTACGREAPEMAASLLEDGAHASVARRRGCEHYDRGCLLKAPCCEKLYTCRLCHDNQEDHQLDRFKVKEVQCINCKKVQHAQKTCEECSTLFGEYYCGICHLFDKDKKQYHCEKCGICRIGPKEEFFHCLKCNLCLAINLQGKHKCIENVSRQNCPICLEDIHTSRVVAHVLPCGHLLHRTCYEEMLKEGYRCPICMHSALDMSRYWRQLDDEVAQTPMPSEYQNMTVDILCNDCSGRSTVQFHILGMKCSICESYNTAQTGGCRISLNQQ